MRRCMSNPHRPKRLQVPGRTDRLAIDWPTTDDEKNSATEISSLLCVGVPWFALLHLIDELLTSYRPVGVND